MKVLFNFFVKSFSLPNCPLNKLDEEGGDILYVYLLADFKSVNTFTIKQLCDK